jgi:hypothetical protein
MALGGVYLDRGRVADALREFTAAAPRSHSRRRLHAQGIANSPPFPDNAAAAVLAFQKASALDPTDVVSAYLLGGDWPGGRSRTPQGLAAGSGKPEAASGRADGRSGGAFHALRDRRRSQV